MAETGGGKWPLWASRLGKGNSSRTLRGSVCPRVSVAVALCGYTNGAASAAVAFEGIKEVIFISDKYHDSDEMTAARRLFDMAGVAFRYAGRARGKGGRRPDEETHLTLADI